MTSFHINLKKIQNRVVIPQINQKSKNMISLRFMLFYHFKSKNQIKNENLPKNKMR